MSSALPMARPQASWIISSVLPPMMVSSAETARNDAADAARPSTRAVIRAEWSRSRFMMATASNTSPPGELIRMVRSVVPDGSEARAWATSAAEIPQGPPQESIGP
jgi:hypothetical protein